MSVTVSPNRLTGSPLFTLIGGLCEPVLTEEWKRTLWMFLSFLWALCFILSVPQPVPLNLSVTFPSKSLITSSVLFVLVWVRCDLRENDVLSSYSASRSLDIKTAPIYGFNKFCHRILCNCRVEKVRVKYVWVHCWMGVIVYFCFQGVEGIWWVSVRRGAGQRKVAPALPWSSGHT